MARNHGIGAKPWNWRKNTCARDMEQKKVSICLPVYNGAKYLSQAITSVLNQTYQNWELLIADDCSTDESSKIAVQFARNEPRIKFWVNQKNAGLFANYNICMENSTGDFIKPFAQDDLLEKTCLARMVEELEATPEATLITAARTVIDENGNATGVERFYEETSLFKGTDVITDYIKTFKYKTGTPSQVMFRRKDMGTGYDVTYFLSGDIEYCYRILERGSYLYFNEPLVCFRRHGESATASILKDMSFVSDSFKLFNKYRHFLKDENGKLPLVHKPLIESLTAKINNAIVERKIQYAESDVHGKLTHGKPVADGANLHSVDENSLNYEFAVYQVLLYTAELSLELDRLRAERNHQKEQIAQLSEKVSAVQTEREEMRARLENLENIMQDLYSSQSWKLTEPFRKIKNSLRSS